MLSDIQNPVNPRECFTSDAPNSRYSQAAFLLIAGEMMVGANPKESLAPQEVQDEFHMPSLRRGGRLNARNAVSDFRQRYEITPISPRSIYEPEAPATTKRRRSLMAELVDRIYSKPLERATAGDLLILGLNHPDPLTRAAAACSYADVFDEIGAAVVALLELSEYTVDALARAIAALTLQRLMPRRTFTSRIEPPIEPVRTEMQNALIIHGTDLRFAGTPDSTWWQPGGSFHNFIKSKFRPALYSEPDAYRWSGGLNDYARDLAATELCQWVNNRQLQSPDLIAHSYGGVVAMLASARGLKINDLILLSCPVHKSIHVPNFANIGRVISYQIKLDLVLLAARAGTSFKHPDIHETIIPKWFLNHSDTHDVRIWLDYNLSI